MVVKVKENFGKTRHVKKMINLKKIHSTWRKNVRYHDRILSHKTKSYNFTTSSVQISI